MMVYGKRNIISFFIPSLAGGGAERIWLSLSNGLAERGHNVDLVLSQAQGPYLEQVSPKVRIIDLKASRTIMSLFALASYLKKEKPLVLFSALNHANIIAIIARILAISSTRIFVSVHCFLSLDVQNCERKREKLIPFLIKIFYPLASEIIAVSKGIAKELVEETHLSREKISVIYNPVVTKELLEQAKLPSKDPWLQEKELPVILGVGRLIKQKDFVTLINAFNLLQETTLSRLIILGEGEERAQLESLVQKLGVEDKVKMPGFVSNPYAYMANADIFVLSSGWEGLPTVLIEAMATGIPVVSTDCRSGPDEILEYGKLGSLTPVGNAGALAKAIERTLSSPIDPNVLFRRASVFSQETILDQYLKLYVNDQDSK